MIPFSECSRMFINLPVESMLANNTLGRTETGRTARRFENSSTKYSSMLHKVRIRHGFIDGLGGGSARIVSNY